MPTLTQEPVKKALYGKLASDTLLTAMLGTAIAGYSQAIYFEQHPQGAALPYVVFQKSSGVPIDTFQSGGSLYDETIWMFKAVDRGPNSDVAERIAHQLDVSLTDAHAYLTTHMTGGLTCQFIRRTTDVSYSETADGVRYIHRGANYRITIS